MPKAENEIGNFLNEYNKILENIDDYNKNMSEFQILIKQQISYLHSQLPILEHFENQFDQNFFKKFIETKDKIFSKTKKLEELSQNCEKIKANFLDKDPNKSCNLLIFTYFSSLSKNAQLFYLTNFGFEQFLSKNDRLKVRVTNDKKFVFFCKIYEDLVKKKSIYEKALSRNYSK